MVQLSTQIVRPCPLQAISTSSGLNYVKKRYIHSYTNYTPVEIDEACIFVVVKIQMLLTIEYTLDTPSKECLTNWTTSISLTCFEREGGQRKNKSFNIRKLPSLLTYGKDTCNDATVDVFNDHKVPKLISLSFIIFIKSIFACLIDFLSPFRSISNFHLAYKLLNSLNSDEDDVALISQNLGQLY